MGTKIRSSRHKLNGVRSYRKTFTVRDRRNVAKTWSIKFVRPPLLVDGERCRGVTDPNTKTITMEFGMGPQLTFETFCHEIHHVFEEERGFKLPHGKIYKLERYLADFVAGNIDLLDDIVDW